jgi:mono/diheme cytochrome c family protein
MKKGWRTALIVLSGLAALFLLIQLIPYGRDHTNPAVVSEPNWDGPQTRALAQRACFDCHSNETVWPWYSNIAPVSWLVYRDVEEGRSHLNFSQWEVGGSRALDEIGEVLQEGEMPPIQYTLMHPEARLSDTERQALITGLQNSAR